LRKTDLAYYAGLLDGEGSIKLAKVKDHKGKHKSIVMTITISNNDRSVLDELLSVFGGSVLEVNRANAKGWAAHWRPSFRWNRCGKSAAVVLTKLLPYLRIKRAHAEAALVYAETLHPTWKVNANWNGHLTAEGHRLRGIAVKALREATAKLTHKGAKWVS